MADRLMRRAPLLVLLCCCGTPALAQGALADPTQPPAGLVAVDPAAPDALAAPVLQSVMLPRQGKPMALIGGHQVPLGGKYGDARLVALSEREAVLEGPAGTERLRLTPDAEKRNITATPSAAKRGQGKGNP